MQHNFDEVFDTTSPYWQKVLDIFAKNEKYEKKIVKHRNLHHKFPRSFSKSLGEEVDNDKDNLISLSLADHFLVHYYYYLLAKKGYRQSMALAFMLMARKGMKYITPDTAEAMAHDYEDAVEISRQVYQTDEFKSKLSAANTGKHLSNETRAKMSVARKGRKFSEDTIQKMSESHKGIRNSEETRKKLSESNKGKTRSAETCKRISEARKAYWASRRMHDD